MYNNALNEAREFNHPFTLSNILTFCWILQLLGDGDTAYKLAGESAALADDYGFVFNQMMGMPVLGWAMAQHDEVDEGIEIIQQALTILHSMGANIMRNYFLGILADAFIKLGQLDDAMEVVDEALDLIEHSVERFYEPEIYRLKGELLWTIHHVQDEAETYVQKAIDTSRARHVRWFELRATVCLAKLWQSQGKVKEAYDLLEPLYGWFTEGFNTVDLQVAKQLLEELEVKQ